MRRILPMCALSTVLLLAGVTLSSAETEVPGHPRDLEFAELRFDTPSREDARRDLVTGRSVYVKRDASLPLVDFGVVLRGGSYLDPAAQTGLASVTASMMRVGGTASLEPQEFEDRAEFLAANYRVSAGNSTSSASASCVTPVLDECLDLFFELLAQPRFDDEQLALEKENILESLKQRNDNAQTLASREWAWLMRGQEHFSTRRVTGESLDAIDREALVGFHASSWLPERLTFWASGDIDPANFAERLNRRLAKWQATLGETSDELPWPPPPVRHVPEPGVYVVEKDIPQGNVFIGLPAPQQSDWMDPDQMPTTLMNEILGGGGFIARIPKRVRSDEGLAYSAGSFFNLGTFWQGAFQAGFQSKSETVAFASQIIFEEIERIRNDLISEQELATAKASYIDTFPRNFESPRAVASIFANDDALGRPHEYWTTFRDRVQAVTREQIREAARKYLDPEKMLLLVVGDWQAIEPGDPEGRAKMEEFIQRLSADDAPVQLPERDPVTLEPVAR